MDTRDIVIEGITLKIAPTPIVHLAPVEKALSEKALTSTEGRAAVVAAIYHGIRRARKLCENSGQITLEWLEENIDQHNGPALWRTFFTLNGFLPAKGADGAGEAPAAQAAPPS